MAKKDKSSKRPSFSAPTPPESAEEVVKNEEEEDVVTNETEEKGSTSEKPPAKAITKSRPNDKDATFAQVVPETVVVEEDPDDPKDKELQENTKETTQKTKKNDTKNTAKKAKSELPINRSSAPQNTQTPSSNKNDQSGGIMKAGLVILLILFGISGWVMYLTTQYPDLLTFSFPGTTQPEPTVTPTPPPADETPTPTPIDRSAITLEVLNGVGIAGAAGDTADQLEALGYTIIDTGNAEAQDYQTTTVVFSPDLPDTLQEAFLFDMENEFGEASVSGELEEGAQVDAQVILGQNWFDAQTDATEEPEE